MKKFLYFFGLFTFLISSSSYAFFDDLLNDPKKVINVKLQEAEEYVIKKQELYSSIRDNLQHAIQKAQTIQTETPKEVNTSELDTLGKFKLNIVELVKLLHDFQQHNFQAVNFSRLDIFEEYDDKSRVEQLKYLHNFQGFNVKELLVSEKTKSNTIEEFEQLHNFQGFNICQLDTFKESQISIEEQIKQLDDLMQRKIGRLDKKFERFTELLDEETQTQKNTKKKKKNYHQQN